MTLTRCVLLFCGAVSLSDPEGRTLAEQLAAGGGGIELESWSHLPTGSGLGTSSILAAALVAAVGVASGKEYAPEALTHAVLQVEQMLTPSLTLTLALTLTLTLTLTPTRCSRWSRCSRRAAAGRIRRAA